MKNRLNEEDFTKWLRDAEKYPLGHTEGTFHTPAYMNYYNEEIFSNIFQLSSFNSFQNIQKRDKRQKFNSESITEDQVNKT